MQKSILKRALSLLVCLAVLIAGMPLAIFNVGAEASLSVITDNFDGENNWSSLTSDASPIKDGTFLPANTQLFQSGITNIYTYDNWSDREIKTVEAKYMNDPLTVMAHFLFMIIRMITTIAVCLYKLVVQEVFILTFSAL